jgi:hypothetical protein
VSIRETYTGQGDTPYLPDFVLLGVPVPGGVELWASTELSHAELECEARVRDVEWIDELAEPYVQSSTFTLHAGLRQFVVVRAPDYRVALAGLLARGDWQPGGGLVALNPGGGI